MDIALGTDIIKDDRGNYYVAVQKTGEELVLVNALLDRSYRTVLEFTSEFREQFAQYEGQYLGKVAADALRHDIVFAMKDGDPSRMYALDDVARQYRVVFVDTIEFYRHPGQGASAGS